jgi:hypothetical protein
MVENLRIAYPPCPIALRPEPVVFRLSKSTFPSMLLKIPHHPSRFRSYAEIAELGMACKWFRESVATQE